MDQFDNETLLLKSNLINVESKITRIEHFLVVITNVLSDIVTTKNHIDWLDTTIKTTNIILQAISIIPPIKIPISLISEMINTLENIEHPQCVRLDNFCTKFIDPIKIQIIGLNEKLTHTTEWINSCINKINIIHNNIIKYNDEQIEKMLPNVILSLKNINITFLNISDRINLTNDKIILVTDKSQFFVSINNATTQTNDKIKSLSETISPLHKSLEQNVSVSYNYHYETPKTEKIKGQISFWQAIWDKFITWEKKVKTKTLVYTVKEILSGIENIIETVVNELEREADKILKPILNVIDLNIKIPDIPNINMLSQILDELEILIDINNISSIIQDLNESETALNKLDESINLNNNLI